MYHKLINWLIGYSGTRKDGIEIDTVLQISPYSAATGQRKLFDTAKEKGVDYLFIVDADVCPPSECIEKMLAAGKDVVIAPIWHYDGYGNDIHLGVNPLSDLRKRAYKMGTGLERVSGGGFGAVLINKTAFNCFPEGEPTMPSDYAFYSNCRKSGVEVWVDWSICPTSHYRLVELCADTINNLVKRAA